MRRWNKKKIEKYVRVPFNLCVQTIKLYEYLFECLPIAIGNDLHKSIFLFVCLFVCFYFLFSLNNVCLQFPTGSSKNLHNKT